MHADTPVPTLDRTHRPTGPITQCHRCRRPSVNQSPCPACVAEIDAMARLAPLTRVPDPRSRSRLLLAIGVVAEEAARCGMDPDEVAGRVAFCTEAELLARDLEGAGSELAERTPQ